MREKDLISGKCGSVITLLLTIFIGAAYCSPSIVAVLMVKDESPVIIATLQPLVDGGITNYLILDTGSTDDTVSKTQKFFNDHHVQHAYVVQEPFIDFATSRNRALALTKEKFPQATFMLMLDAEWYLNGVQELIAFCQAAKNQKFSSYFIKIIMNKTLEFYVPRLLRCSSNNYFVGSVHEYLVSTATGKVSTPVFIACNQTKYGTDKSHKRYERDRELLAKEYAHNPKNSRTAFYLAQTYECLGDVENACRYYKRCMEHSTWDQEQFTACLRLAHSIEVLSQNVVKGEALYNWSLALTHYLKAFSMRPWRIEPLIAIARHYLADGDYVLAYFFARQTLDVPYPEQDILFVDRYIYDYERYALIGHSAWYVGDYALGEKALVRALQKYPNDSIVQANLEYIRKKLKKAVD